MSATWRAGNANDDGSATRGWLVGHFIDPSEGVRWQRSVEVKWANHPAGDKRLSWTSDDQRTTLTVLVQGHFRVETTAGSSTMTRPGDYVMWGAGVDHSWEALEDSVVMTVRWPSLP